MFLSNLKKANAIEQIVSLAKENAKTAKRVQSQAGEVYVRMRSDKSSLESIIQEIRKIVSSEKSEKLIEIVQILVRNTGQIAADAALLAAQAGQSGKRFSGVTNDLRALAISTSQSMEESTSMLKESQKNGLEVIHILGELQARLNQIVLDMDAILKQFSVIYEANEIQADKLEHVHSHAVGINLSGRQRMLTQKMCKEFLLIHIGRNEDENLFSLFQTVDLFEKSLGKLKDGDPEIGLEKNEDPEILKQLEKIEQIWSDFKPVILSIRKNRKSKDNIQRMDSLNVILLNEVNIAVELFESRASQ